MDRFRSRLEVTELDARIVPSATTSPVKAAVSTAAIVSQQTTSPLSGTGTGKYLRAPVRYGVGATYLIFGTANLSGLGPVTVTGSVQLPFFQKTGAVTGTLTFASSRGTVTVQLTGP
ncbi:MAG TPA: hypothetical protein VFW33_07505, partial [Gemmataceae bacterium]|nr:hypothetical protein [Gemmataceae bacterium]